MLLPGRGPRPGHAGAERSRPALHGHQVPLLSARPPAERALQPDQDHPAGRVAPAPPAEDHGWLPGHGRGRPAVWLHRGHRQLLLGGEPDSACGRTPLPHDRYFLYHLAVHLRSQRVLRAGTATQAAVQPARRRGARLRLGRFLRLVQPGPGGGGRRALRGFPLPQPDKAGAPQGWPGLIRVTPPGRVSPGW